MKRKKKSSCLLRVRSCQSILPSPVSSSPFTYILPAGKEPICLRNNPANRHVQIPVPEKPLQGWPSTSSKPSSLGDQLFVFPQGHSPLFTILQQLVLNQSLTSRQFGLVPETTRHAFLQSGEVEISVSQDQAHISSLFICRTLTSQVRYCILFLG